MSEEAFSTKWLVSKISIICMPNIRCKLTHILAIANQKWETKDAREVFDNVGMLAYGMSIQKCRGPNGWLDYVPYKFSNDIMEAAFEHMVPERCAVTLRSGKFKHLDDLETEQWTGTKYRVWDITDEELYQEDEYAWPEEFTLPAKNPYVTTELTIKNDPSREWLAPKKISKKSNGELWFKSGISSRICYST